MESDQQELVDEVLRKIGRNVLTIQKIEGLLKFLIARSELKGTKDNLVDRATSRDLKVSNQTLGTLVKNYMGSVYSDNATQNKSDVDDCDGQDDVLFEFQFNIRADSDEIKIRDEELREVVKERNHLIHHMLIQYDPASIENCIAISEQLDTQFNKLSTEHEKLSILVKQFLEMSAQVIDEIRAKS